jgi:predicted RNA-binding Zn-ribbon protein involved in translation (DUF1610 family)
MSRHKCPRCGSRDNATILRGYPAFTEKLQDEMDRGKVVLGGCVVTGFDPRWVCNSCGVKFGMPGEKAPQFTFFEADSANN